jgi:hypothetical protein
MGLTKRQPGHLHQYFCRVLGEIASSFSFVDLSAGGGMGKKRELLNHWQRA